MILMSEETTKNETQETAIAKICKPSFKTQVAAALPGMLTPDYFIRDRKSVV